MVTVNTYDASTPRVDEIEQINPHVISCHKLSGRHLLLVMVIQQMMAEQFVVAYNMWVDLLDLIDSKIVNDIIDISSH